MFITPEMSSVLRLLTVISVSTVRTPGREFTWDSNSKNISIQKVNIIDVHLI